MILHRTMILAVICLFFLGGRPLYAEPMEVTILEQPIEVEVEPESEIIELIHQRQLDADDDYESDYKKVGEYRQVTIFVEVIPDTVFSDPFTTPVYTLDAYFALRASTTKHKKMSGEERRLEDYGVQEFGAMKIGGKEMVEIGSFQKLTTKMTTGRALTSPIYGPYLRVKLTNHTDRTVQYRVSAYLTR